MFTDGEIFALVVIGFLVIVVIGWLIVLTKHDEAHLYSNDEYDKKIIKRRKRCKDKQL